MDLGLRGRHALITGASKGIGRAVALGLAEEGCGLVLVSRGAEGLDALAEEIRSRYDVPVTTQTADLSRSEEQALVADVAGDVDILVNNAGSNPGGFLEDIPEDLWRKSWDLKVFGYINMTRHIYTRMKARRSGVIVNVIGSSGQRMSANYILGSSGNIALMGFTRALGSRSTDFGVRVVGVNPGLTGTDRATTMLKTWSQGRHGSADQWQSLLGEMDLPFGRMGEPKEVADVVVFLASSRASYVSGTVVAVDGGGADRHD